MNTDNSQNTQPGTLVTHPGQKDRIAFCYFYTSDAVVGKDTYTQKELADHLQAADSPIKKFWDEVSYGKYEYVMEIHMIRMSATNATIEKWKKEKDANQQDRDFYDFVVAHYEFEEGKGLPATGDHKTLISLKECDHIFFVLGGQQGLTGGYNSRFITVEGEKHPDKNVIAYAMPTVFNEQGNKADPYRFWFMPKGKPYKGPHDNYNEYYSEPSPLAGLWDSDSTLLHEWGHSLGWYSHANFWTVKNPPLGGGNVLYNGKVMEEYGNYFDIMGSAGYAMHPNAFYKYKSPQAIFDIPKRKGTKNTWLTEQKYKEVITDKEATFVTLEKSKNIPSFQVTIHPLEAPLGTDNQLRAVCIKPPGTLNISPAVQKALGVTGPLEVEFWLEFRKAIGFDTHLSHPYLEYNTNGLMCNMVYKTHKYGEKGSWLLNLGEKPTSQTPANLLVPYQDHHHCTLNEGWSFYNADTQVLIDDVKMASDMGSISFSVSLGAQNHAEGVTSPDTSKTFYSQIFEFTNLNGFEGPTDWRILNKLVPIPKSEAFLSYQDPKINKNGKGITLISNWAYPPAEKAAFDIKFPKSQTLNSLGPILRAEASLGYSSEHPHSPALEAYLEDEKGNVLKTYELETTGGAEMNRVLQLGPLDSNLSYKLVLTPVLKKDVELIVDIKDLVFAVFFEKRVS